ncbi:MAG: hypothetical protein R3A78_03235 [Polyangiales bacterium]|nr:hypothetical protein [Myxococcales bacterium]
MKTFERIVRWSLVGAILGGVLAAWWAPSLLLLIPSTMGTLVNGTLCPCDEAIRSVSAAVVKCQIAGIFVGAFTFGVLGIFVERFRKNRAASKEPPAPPAA